MPIRSSSTTRNLEARKSSIPTIGKGKPLDARGNEGDIAFRRTSEGLKLYIKANHKWHGIKVGESFDSLEEKVNEIKSKVDTIKQFRLPSTYSVTGDFVLDASGDIELNADGATVTFKDNTVTNYTFEGGLNPVMTMNSLSVGDSFSITLAGSGVATLATVDSSSDEGHLVLDADGDIHLDAVLSGVNDNIAFKNAGTTFSAFQVHHSASYFYLYENGGASTDDYLAIKVEADGASTISTQDLAGNAADLTLDADGTIKIDSEDGIVNFRNSGTNMATFSSNRLRIYNQTDTADYFNINVGSNAATTISTIDDGAEGGNLTLDADGSIILEPYSGGVYIKESADAAADSAGYGQIWVHDTTPNELCFTDDAGTDVIGIGKYQYDMQVTNFYATSSTTNWVPLPGYVIERTSLASQNEYVCMVAPYDGYIEKIVFRSEIAHNGNLVFTVSKSSDGTEVPNTVSGVHSTAINVADDTTVDINTAATSWAVGGNSITKGDIFAIAVTSPSAPFDTNVTVVLKWDITS